MTPQYPVTRYEPSPLIDLSARAERERLSPSAVRAFLKIMERWDVREENARALLGGISHRQFCVMKKEPGHTLGIDPLTRISYLVGIFKGLNVLYSEGCADAWVQRSNINRIFGGESPLTYLIKGGLPALQTLRRLIDARQDGL